MISATNPEARLTELLDLLSRHKGLAQAGFAPEPIPDGVLVHRRGHARGLWHANPHSLTWTPAGYNEPTHYVLAVEDAVLHTLATLLPPS